MHPSLEPIYAVLSTTPERWQRLVAVLSAELLTRQPAVEEWSACECLRHLLNADQALFPVRVRAFLAGQDFSAFDPRQNPASLEGLTAEQLALAFAQVRRENLLLLEQVADEDLARSVRHPQFGAVTLEQMLHTWAGHDLMHTVQAERALMQPFLLACGPWRAFFQDHEVKGVQQ